MMMMMMSSFSQDRDRPRVVKYKNAVENSQAKFGPNREGRGWRFGVRESGEYGRWVGVSGFSREESLVWCRDSSLQFLLNYSSTEGQGQACSESAAVYVCSSGKRTLIHTCECYEHSCMLEQRICPFWGNPIIKACKMALSVCGSLRCNYQLKTLDVASV